MGQFSIWHWLVIFILFSPLIIGMLVMGAQRRILLKYNGETGVVKNGYVGYCWSYFFIGWLVPIVRGEIGIGTLHLILTLVTFGLFHLIMPFLYNKQFMNRHLTNGWVLADNEENNQYARIKLNIAA